MDDWAIEPFLTVMNTRTANKSSICCREGINVLSGIMGTGVVLLDADRKLLFANADALRLMGCDTEEEARGCWGTYLPRLSEAMKHLPEAQGPVRVTLDVPQANGLRLFRLEIHPLDGHSEKSYLALLRDRQTIDALETELLAASRLHTQAYLSAGVIHGLVAPLNAMKITLELLELSVSDEGPAEPEGVAGSRQRYVTVLKTELARFERYIQLLRQQAKPPASASEELDLRLMIEDIVRALEYPMRIQKVAIHFSKPDAAVKVKGNREHIKQALFNLIIEALRRMPGGGNLNGALDKQGGEARFVLQHDGPAGSPQLLDEINRLYLTAPRDKASVGLFLARRVAELHGGAMQVEPDKGMRVSWCLPLVLS
jgi:signal transduction histidine kinase